MTVNSWLYLAVITACGWTTHDGRLVGLAGFALLTYGPQCVFFFFGGGGQFDDIAKMAIIHNRKMWQNLAIS